MSPVCKKCHNYVMKLPCSHCGSDLSFTDRTKGEIKAIVPIELQGDFAEPPPPEFVDSLPVRTSSPSPSKKTSESQYKAESSHRSDTPSSSTGTSTIKSSSDIDYRLTSIESILDDITSQLTTLMKSQKVIETILTKINSELLKLRGK